MYNCNICNSTSYSNETVKKFYEIDGEIIVVDNIPAKVCSNCKKENFTKETLKHIQELIFGEPKEMIQAKRYDYV